MKRAAFGLSGCSLREPIRQLQGDANQKDSGVICSKEELVA